MEYFTRKGTVTYLVDKLLCRSNDQVVSTIMFCKNLLQMSRERNDALSLEVEV